MGQVRHSSATTTHAFRATLSRELGINLKTVAKWRKRSTVEDLKTGPKAPRSTTLSEAEEAMIAAFRQHTLLSLNDCLYALRPTIPHLTRSAVHRCLQRHGISRLPDVEGDKPKRQRLKRCPMVVAFAEVDHGIAGVHVQRSAEPAPAAGEALVQITAATVNYRGLLALRGQVPSAMEGA